MTYSIRVSRVSKRYRIGQTWPTLKDLLTSRRESHKPRYHWALQDLSFQLQPGEALGVVGPNGAGKTTILKVLSKVTRPTSGEIKVNGRLSALIELGAGFHPDLSGRENIYLNGALLGMRSSEVRARFDAIIDFAGIKKHLDTPVKRYSSGMYARLGFAVAAHVEPEVLLVDEVLSVGDMAFQLKCYERMKELLRGGTTLLFVSHNFKAVQQVCSRAIVLYQGRVAFDGPAPEAIAEYGNTLRRQAPLLSKPTDPYAGGLGQRWMTHAARIEQVELLDEDGTPAKVLKSGDRMRVAMDVQFLEDAESPVFGCSVHGENGEVVYETATNQMGVRSRSYRAGERTRVEFTLQLHLVAGVYTTTVDLAYADLSCYYDYLANAASFVVVDASTASGTANLRAEVSFDEGAGTLAMDGLGGRESSARR